MTDDACFAVEPGKSAGDDSPLGDTEVCYATSSHVDEVFKIFVGRCGTARAEQLDWSQSVRLAVLTWPEKDQSWLETLHLCLLI